MIALIVFAIAAWLNGGRPEHACGDPEPHWRTHHLHTQWRGDEGAREPGACHEAEGHAYPPHCNAWRSDCDSGDSTTTRGGDHVFDGVDGAKRRCDGILGRRGSSQGSAGLTRVYTDEAHGRPWNEKQRLGEADNPGPPEPSTQHGNDALDAAPRHEAVGQMAAAAQNCHRTWSAWAGHIRTRMNARAEGRSTEEADQRVAEAACAAREAAVSLAQARAGWDSLQPPPKADADLANDSGGRKGGRARRTAADSRDRDEEVDDEPTSARELRGQLRRITNLVHGIVAKGRPDWDGMLTLRRAVQEAAGTIAQGRALLQGARASTCPPWPAQRRKANMDIVMTQWSR